MLVSVGFFAMAALLVATLFVPRVGHLLAHIGGAYLVGLFFDAGMLALLAEGLGGGSPVKLLCSCLYFGGYLVAAAISHAQAARFERGIRLANAGKAIAWDRFAQDLVVQAGPQDETHASTLHPDALIQRFGVDRVYRQGAFASDGDMRATWLAREEAPPPGAGRLDGLVHRTPYDGGLGTGRPHRWFRDLSLFDGPAMPRAGHLTIVAGPITERSEGLCLVVEQRIDIRVPGRQPVPLAVGYAQPLPWLPWPVIGREMAGPHDHREVLRFARGRGHAHRAVADQAAVVAAALQLPPISLRDRFAERLGSCGHEGAPDPALASLSPSR